MCLCLCLCFALFFLPLPGAGGFSWEPMIKRKTTTTNIGTLHEPVRDTEIDAEKSGTNLEHLILKYIYFTVEIESSGDRRYFRS